MIEVDLHTHSIFSLCGIHTVLELLQAARSKGMKALAVTDHGQALGGRLNSIFFERLHDPIPGIRLLKGIEANVTDKKGGTDCPIEFLPYMDVVLLGLHQTIPSGLGKKENTEILIRAMERNRHVDIITHPYDDSFPLDLNLLARAARDLGVALELNNSKTLLGRVPDHVVLNFLSICKKHSCPVALNSDAHVIDEIGRDDSVKPFLEEVDFPWELIVNRDAESAFEFTERRRKFKQ